MNYLYTLSPIHQNTFSLQAMANWFESWFDSPFYHQLYKNRDRKEASAFIDTLIDYIQPATNQLVLDLACGKGRHSIHLNKLGLHVEGADYSKNSIAYAKSFENKSLHFFHHDMRQPLPKQYNLILNLFTSFGYFATNQEHQDTIQHIYNGLSNNGLFILDYLNTTYTLNHLKPQERIVRDDITFDIKRELKNNRIIKTISFDYEGGNYVFTEQVAAFTLDDFKAMTQKAGFNLINTFGDYQLNPYNKEESPRLVTLFKK